MAKLQPADVVAIILISGYLILQLMGKNSELNSSILLIVGFYFGKEHYPPTKTIL